jgi:hypothetical protein
MLKANNIGSSQYKSMFIANNIGRSQYHIALKLYRLLGMNIYPSLEINLTLKFKSTQHHIALKWKSTKSEPNTEIYIILLLWQGGIHGEDRLEVAGWGLGSHMGRWAAVLGVSRGWRMTPSLGRWTRYWVGRKLSVAGGWCGGCPLVASWGRV